MFVSLRMHTAVEGTPLRRHEPLTEVMTQSVLAPTADADETSEPCRVRP